ncbi:hypothetical protein ACH4VX_24475 [Streptomyces sp. NPDC020731]|uniref:hypothetical protein n=1 Tax=Streptomyces sp. NPDC020731 TaxID=3365085 RepID=UPI0037AAA5FA
MQHRTRPIRLTAAAAVLLAGCGASEEHHADAEPAAVVSQADNSPYRGTALDSGFTKPDLVLTDTAGKPFDLPLLVKSTR